MADDDDDFFSEDVTQPLGPYKPDPVIFNAGVAAYDAGDYETAFQTWLPMAQGGDLAAMRNVAHLLRLGLGTDKDADRAAFFYRRAARRGLAGAQANLGLMLLKGDGIDQNKTEAAKWFMAATRRGHMLSAFELGKMLETGDGVGQSYEAAYALYKRAAEAGHEPARQRMALIAPNLDPGAQSELLAGTPCH